MEQVKFFRYCVHCRLSPVYYVPECDDEEQYAKNASKELENYLETIKIEYHI